MKTHKLFFMVMLVILGGIAKVKAQGGSNNYFAGDGAGLFSTTDAEDNTAVGNRSMYFSENGETRTPSGDHNTALGKFTLHGITTANENTAIGSQAMFLVTEGSSNVAVGRQAGFAIGTGSLNTFIGANCGAQIGSGIGNTFLGRVFTAGDVSNRIILADGGTNVFSAGRQRLYIDSNGYTGIGLGNNNAPLNMLEINATGAVSGTSGLRFRNYTSAATAIDNPTNKVLSVNTDGDVILVNNTTETSNNNDWHLTGNLGTSPSLVRLENTILPSSFLGTLDEQDLVFRRNKIRSGLIQAPGSSSVGGRYMNIGNTSFGYDSLSFSSLTGSSNTAIGVSALKAIESGYGNVAVGSTALQNSKLEYGNVAVGYAALQTLTSNGTNPYNSNTAIGSFAGSNLKFGNGNVFIGLDAGPVPPASGQINSFSQRLYIDADVNNNLRGNNTPLIYGDFAARTLTFNLNNEDTSIPNLNSRVTINSGVAVNPGVNPLASSDSGLRFSDMNNTSPSTPNTTKKVLSVNANANGGDVILVNDRSLYDEDGNINTLDSDYIGLRIVTMDNNNLFFNTADSDGGFGKIYLGDSADFSSVTGDYRMYVEGGIMSEKAKVALRSGLQWRDDVFEADYKLMSLTEIESFVKENKHLPGIESAEELVKSGLDLGDMQAKQMGKIEELTLYAIEQEKRLEKQGKEIEELKALVKTLLEKK